MERGTLWAHGIERGYPVLLEVMVPGNNILKKSVLGSCNLLELFESKKEDRDIFNDNVSQRKESDMRNIYKFLGLNTNLYGKHNTIVKPYKIVTDNMSLRI